jgi:large subunit ribosomal protein L5
MPDLYKKYKEKIVPDLMKKLGLRNIMETPKLEKIVVRTGISASSERDAFNEAKAQIANITGQAPVITKTRKNIANFKLRAGMPVGVMVTLRGSRMYEFLDRFVHVTLPRVRDFRGVPSKRGFDGSGCYNLGVQDASVFTEIDLDKMKYPLGLTITFVTSGKDDKQARELLAMLEMPFGE